MSLSDLGPFPLSPEDCAYEDSLREVLVKELYGRSSAALGALVVLLGVLWSVMGFAMELSPALPWVFGFMGVVVASRLTLLLQVKAEPRRYDSRQLNRLFFVGSTAVALGFVIMNTLAFPYLNAAQVGLLALCHAGVNSVALVSMSASLWAYLVYMGLDMASFILLTAVYRPWPGYTGVLLLLLGLYMTALVFMAVQLHRSMRSTELLRLRLQDMALQDSLTGLRNRRFLMEFMPAEVDHALRSWAPGASVNMSLAVLMLDLDHFKQVNDTFGHPAGDAVLRQLAVILKDTLRKPDLVIRWGGEEFVVIARGADRGYALQLADRIQQRIRNHVFLLPDGQELYKTASIGFSLYPFSTKVTNLLRWEEVLSLADAALYRAKQTGRNRSIGVMQGDAPWEGAAEFLVDRVAKDLDAAARRGLVKLVGDVKH